MNLHYHHQHHHRLQHTAFSCVLCITHTHDRMTRAITLNPLKASAGRTCWFALFCVCVCVRIDTARNPRTCGTQITLVMRAAVRLHRLPHSHTHTCAVRPKDSQFGADIPHDVAICGALRKDAYHAKRITERRERRSFVFERTHCAGCRSCRSAGRAKLCDRLLATQMCDKNIVLK